MSPVPDEQADVDPLYDPTWAIFIYAAWALLGWVVSETVGLVALLSLTALLGIVALSQERQPDSRSFAADFSSILLFCAATMAGAVLFLRAVGSAPELLLAAAAFAGAAAILANLWRLEKASKLDAQVA